MKRFMWSRKKYQLFQQDLLRISQTVVAGKDHLVARVQTGDDFRLLWILTALIISLLIFTL